MPDEGLKTVKPAAFWNAIQDKAREHATTGELWQAIRETAADRGWSTQGLTLQEVNRMRSAASSMVYSGERLARSKPDDPLGDRFIGRQVYAGSDWLSKGNPAYHVRFQVDIQTVGTIETHWYTMQYDGSLPATTGELYDDIALYADELGGDYGVGVVGYGAVEIGAY
jgi:hypothetical protein